MVIWKDVPGLLNADPKYFDNPIKIDAISFREAIELSYYGATIIHPKTIKPLQNKHIALRIKSFIDPAADGTIIYEDFKDDNLIPSFIFKVRPNAHLYPFKRFQLYCRKKSRTHLWHICLL